MRPDLVDKYAAAGAMPTMAALMRTESRERTVCFRAFRPTPEWVGRRSPTWPGTTARRTTPSSTRAQNFVTGSTSFAAPGILQADTIAQAAERAGKSVVSMEWVAARSYTPALQGPVVDFRTFFSARGVLVNYDLPGQPAGANAFGVSYQRTGAADNQTPLYDVPAVTDAPLGGAGGWTNVPATQGTPKQTQFRLRSTSSANNVTRLFDLFIYDTAASAAGVRPRARRSVDCCERHRGRESRTGRVGGREGHAE